MYDVSDDRSLVLAVIYQAMKDVTSPNQRVREEARAWFTQVDFRECCDVLRIEPDAILSIVGRAINEYDTSGTKSGYPGSGRTKFVPVSPSTWEGVLAKLSSFSPRKN